MLVEVEMAAEVGVAGIKMSNLTILACPCCEQSVEVYRNVRASEEHFNPDGSHDSIQTDNLMFTEGEIIMRQRNFQSLIIELECGHFVSFVTSFFRLQRDRLACLKGDLIRKGVWCKICKTTDQPKRWIKICNETKAEKFVHDKMR
jgi:hypothetical protein